MTPFWSAFLHVLLPKACVACHRDMPAQDQRSICADCLRSMPAPLNPACARCAGSLGVRRDICGACVGKLFACRIIRAACVHRGPAAALVHAFKFRGFPCAARDAGRLMAERYERTAELSDFNGLVPVPLHPSRLRERGYNQAEILARELAARTGIPLFDALTRRRFANAAWRLGRAARRDQLAGAFEASEGAGATVAGKRLLIVDDVCASSTTLEECALALRRAGARDVAGFVFSRAGRITESRKVFSTTAARR